MKKNALYNLRKERPNLTLQQYRTIKGQILAGDIEGADRGLRKILRRIEK